MYDRRSVLSGSAATVAGGILVSSCRSEQERPSAANASGIDDKIFTSPPSAPSANKGLNQPDPPEFARQIGMGFQTAFGREVRHLVVGTPQETSVSPDEEYRPNTLKYHMTESQEQFNSVISRSAKAKGRYGIFKASGSASSRSEVATDSYSINICAIAKKYRKALVLDPKTAVLSTEAARIYERYRRRPDLLAIYFGDAYVSHLVPASELVINMKFTAKSRQDKKDLKAKLSASFGSFAKGKGSYSELVNSATNAKQIEIEISGLNGSGVPQNVSEEEVRRILKEFLDDERRNSYVTAMGYEKLSSLSYKGRPIDFVSERGLLQQHRYVDEMEVILAYLENAARDAEYVARNPDEFDVATRERAAADLEAVRLADGRIVSMAQDAYAEYMDEAATANTFDINRLIALKPKLDLYIQVDRPNVSPPPPPPRPTPAPQRRGGGCNGSCHEGPPR